MKLNWLFMPIAALVLLSLSSRPSKLEAAPEAAASAVPAAAQTVAYAKPTNLTVLPKNIPPAQLRPTLRLSRPPTANDIYASTY